MLCFVTEYFGAIASCCRGACFIGPHYHVLLINTALIVGPSIAEWGWGIQNVALRVIGIVLTLVSLFFLWRCALTDPGVVPKQKLPESSDESRDVTEDYTVIRNGVPTTIKVRRRWCYTCHLLRPPRASHCPYCDCCIERHDHHCPWTGTCIGARNYRYFYGFLLFTAILLWYSIAVCIYQLVTRTQAVQGASSGGDAFWSGVKADNYINLIAALFCVIVCCFVCPLLVYHTNLIYRNETTHEVVRQSFAADAPFNEGCTRNCATILCKAEGPSKLGRRAMDPAEADESFELRPSDTATVPITDQRSAMTTDTPVAVEASADRPAVVDVGTPEEEEPLATAATTPSDDDDGKMILAAHHEHHHATNDTTLRHTQVKR